MNVSVILIGSLFTCFASLVLAYISMATMIGPWIAPAVVLMASILLKMRLKKRSDAELAQELALIQTMAQAAGLVAVGIGFTLPTLYFLDPEMFSRLLMRPGLFAYLVFIMTIIAGGLGNWLGKLFSQRLIVQGQLPFPVSSLIHNTISSQSQGEQASSVLSGIGLSWFACLIRDGLTIGRYFTFPALLPAKEWVLWLGSADLTFAFAPMIWAIGFTTGFSIVIPLLVGMISKYLIINPLNYHVQWMPFSLFAPMKDESFIMAFCCGLVLYELCSELLVPKKMMKMLEGLRSYNHASLLSRLRGFFESSYRPLFSWIEPVGMIGASSLFFTYFKFSLGSQLFIFIMTFIVTYQTNFLSGQIGLVPFGRFVTLVMLPSMLLFKFDAVQITLLCVFVSIVLATSSNLLFEYKVGELNGISQRTIYLYQWLGLIIGALVLGGVFWLLFNNLAIGTSELFAQRGRSRALLIQSFNFDLRVLMLGAIYGLILKPFKISPTMVFGGILMPNSLTIGLVLGALGSKLAKKPEEQYPFWSGVFSAESVWMIVSILLKMA